MFHSNRRDTGSARLLLAGSLAASLVLATGCEGTLLTIGPTDLATSYATPSFGDAGTADAGQWLGVADAGPVTELADAGPGAELADAASPPPPPPPSSDDAGTPTTPPPAPPPVDPGPVGDPGPVTYDLGTPPAELAVHWPVAPTITRDVRVTSEAALAAALSAGTRVTLAVSVANLEINASDVELVVEPGVHVDHLLIHNRISRIRVRGGSYGDIVMELPATFWPTEAWHREWLTTDVLIDDVDVNAADTAFMLRGGIRIAVTNSRARAGRYCVWIGDTADFNSEDIIIAGNSLTSAGPEATLRFVHVQRSAVVDNRLSNTFKHNYRIHGRSADNWAARNVFVEAGIMIGTLPADLWPIGRQWVEDNTLHHDLPSLLELDTRTAPLFMRRNHVYSNVWDCLVCGTPQPSWVLEGNEFAPFTPAPPE